MKKRDSVGVVLAMLLFSAVPSHAEIITFNYTASVTGAGTNSFGIGLNDLVSGTFSYDTAGVDLDPLDLTHGRYDSGLVSFSASVQSLSITGSDFSITQTEVRDDLFTGTAGLYEDAFLPSALLPQTNSGTPGWYLRGVSAVFSNLPGTAPVSPLTSDAIPDSLSLTDWSQAGFRLVVNSVDEQESFRLNGNFTSLTQIRPTSVPEPASLSLMLLGMAAVVAGRRHRRMPV